MQEFTSFKNTLVIQTHKKKEKKKEQIRIQVQNDIGI